MPPVRATVWDRREVPLLIASLVLIILNPPQALRTENFSTQGFGCRHGERREKIVRKIGSALCHDAPSNCMRASN